MMEKMNSRLNSNCGSTEDLLTFFIKNPIGDKMVVMVVAQAALITIISEQMARAADSLLGHFAHPKYAQNIQTNTPTRNKRENLATFTFSTTISRTYYNALQPITT